MTAEVEGHYHRDGLEVAILEALAAAGKDIDNLTTADLAPVDEFHIGGRKATLELFDALSPGRGQHALDIGCGIGGASRLLAERHGAHVTGIDLTPEYVEVARALARRTSLEESTRYEVASATSLPLDDASMDIAFSIHVAMNIEDKAAMLAEAARVVRPGGIFAIYDVMRGEAGAPILPAPWAEEESMSFVASPGEMGALLCQAGFAVMREEDRTVRGREELVARITRGKPASGSLGLHMLMGANAPAKLSNMIRSIDENRLRTVRFVCRRS